MLLLLWALVVLVMTEPGAAGVLKSTEVDVCRTGAYAVKEGPFGPCPGFRACESGFYCSNSQRHSCPAGTYGATSSLTNSSCSGPCAPGFWCPLGSVSSTANKCGNVTVYCPEGSYVPLHVPAGYYSVGSDGTDVVDIGNVFDEHDENRRSGIIMCPKGWYCPGYDGGTSSTNGRRVRCQAGRYGPSTGLASVEECLLCPAGYYCPIGSVEPYQYPCGKDPKVYCPEGSAYAHTTEMGYYAVTPVEYKEGITSSAGEAVISVSYSSELGELAGYSQTVVCPAGSYCLNGVRSVCPGGRYGGTKQMTNSSCSGACIEGWYCPAGSVSPYQNACGDPSTYCPASSAAPTPVSPGYYTVASFDNETAFDMPNGENHLGLRHTMQTLCPPGYYCLTDGLAYACPPGRYGAASGLTASSCSGSCQAGHYCEEASIVATSALCGSEDRFCREGSGAPEVARDGYYTIDGEGAEGAYLGTVDTRSWERKCEPGYYCLAGARAMCAPGYYGGLFRETRQQCQGGCREGYYCPEGSTTPTEVECGDASRYCPANTSIPTEVSTGYYTNGDTVSTRVNETIAPIGYYAIRGLLYACPAGYYGESEGLADPYCTGQCLVEGYYCPIASRSPYQEYCGNDNRICPAGSRAPLVVREGYYAADYDYEECEPGRFRQDWRDWVDVSLPGLSDVVTWTNDTGCQLCPEGKYKTEVADNVTHCLDCPFQSESAADRRTCVCKEVVAAGTFKYFNISTGLCLTLDDSAAAAITAYDWNRVLEPGNSSMTRSQEYECEPGHYCVQGKRSKCPSGRYGARRRETGPQCQGECSPGYYCQSSSISQYSNPCGGADRICAGGSSVPEAVPPGYYSNEDAREDLRTYSTLCPAGQYCPGDGRRYDCPAGRYGAQAGISDDQCSDICARGHYCEAGSSSPTQHECGSAAVYCPRGATQPTPVTAGFYSDFSGDDAGAQRLWNAGNSTCSIELLCEPGYYCVGGVKFPCPPGTFGWRYGAREPTCGGKCAAGYYCPSYLEPQPDAPSHTAWPLAPHTTATPYKCGGVSFLCPRGSFYPVLVGGGNYTVGGTDNVYNMTRTGQKVCLPGTYCSDGVVNLCPKGRYGVSEGSSVPTCTGWCPAGHYCPAGTSEPFLCSEGYYATGAAWNCSACPGQRDTPMPCNDARECCFKG